MTEIPIPAPAPCRTLLLWGVDPVGVRTTADVLIWLGVVAVPAALLWHAGKQSPPVRRLLTLVAVFAAAAGTAHVLRTLPTTGPSAWPAAAAVVAAAVAGWAAAVALLRQLPPALGDIRQSARDREDDLERLRLLEAAVTASRDGVMIAETAPDDQPGPQVVFANPAFEQMMGYSSGEAIGLTPSVFCFPKSQRAQGGTPNPEAADDAEQSTLDAVRKALRGSRPVRLELPGRRKDGTEMWAEWQLVPVADEQGYATHWIAVLRDTTERRVLEEQLRESQKMEAVGRLAGGIAHDFNNLLTVIRGNAELLRESPLETATAQELIDDIRGASERAGGLVRQLLTFGRRQPARPEVLDLNVVVNEMAGMLSRLLGERVAVVANLSKTPIRARIDRGQIEQVVMNLAVNARDAMPRGGTLTISTDAFWGGTPTSPVKFAALVVSDTGTGMTAEVRAKIFEPFFTTKGPGKGTGLGLATVYGIVTQAGGRISVESTPGAGTSFRVDIPWCDDQPTSSWAGYSGTSTTREHRAGRGRTVLLVEDEDGVRKLARIALEAYGYTVVEAPDGETALDSVANWQSIDLLVTDITMPGMGGRELAEQVRARRTEIGVVFISGYTADAGRLDGVPGSIFLAKPFTPADLLKVAAKAIARATREVPARA